MDYSTLDLECAIANSWQSYFLFKFKGTILHYLPIALVNSENSAMLILKGSAS
jgi:hypothetical protein